MRDVSKGRKAKPGLKAIDKAGGKNGMPEPKRQRASSARASKDPTKRVTKAEKTSRRERTAPGKPTPTERPASRTKPSSPKERARRPKPKTVSDSNSQSTSTPAQRTARNKDVRFKEAGARTSDRATKIAERTKRPARPTRPSPTKLEYAPPSLSSIVAGMTSSVFPRFN